MKHLYDDNFFIFWDKETDEPEILGEDGEFYFYGEDAVAINQGNESGRFWCRLDKLVDVTPLNARERFDILNPETGEWVSFSDVCIELIQQVQRLAGARYWRDVL